MGVPRCALWSCQAGRLYPNRNQDSDTDGHTAAPITGGGRSLHRPGERAGLGNSFPELILHDAARISQQSLSIPGGMWC